MITVSLCMIVKNEEDVLARCLESVGQVADEIIIVDTGSTDKTKQTAGAFTSRIFDFEWINNFSAARNYSFSKAEMDYIMWLDADDILEEKDRTALIELKNSLKADTDVVMMKYNTSFDESGNPLFSYYRERLVKNNGNYIWKGAVHEAIEPAGNVIYTDISINHKKLKPSDPDRNLNIYLNMKKNGIFFSPRDRFYYARELYYHGLFEAAAEEFEGFLSSGQGWLENELEAIKFLSECYHSMNDDIKALETLMRAFVYDTPRAEILCDIGRYFILFGKYRQAAYWYELALKCERNDKTGGFIKPDCYDYIPYIQLCVCYDMMGNKNKAEMYNEKAGRIKPGSASYLYNKRYFSEHLT